MKYLLIDDQREFGTNGIPKPTDKDEWGHALTYESGIFALQYEGPWDVLYLDHDLGEENPKHTGYGIMNWLEENQIFLPKKIVLVTSNPVGRKNMQAVINKLYGDK